MKSQDSAERQATAPVIYCPESRRLLESFGEAVEDVLMLHEQQFLAIVDGDLECHRFDLLIPMANEKKQKAKYLTCAIWKATGAPRAGKMSLTAVEREKITGNALNTRSKPGTCTMKRASGPRGSPSWPTPK